MIQDYSLAAAAAVGAEEGSDTVAEVSKYQRMTLLRLITSSHHINRRTLTCCAESNPPGLSVATSARDHQLGYLTHLRTEWKIDVDISSKFEEKAAAHLITWHN